MFTITEVVTALILSLIMAGFLTFVNTKVKEKSFFLLCLNAAAWTISIVWAIFLGVGLFEVYAVKTFLSIFLI